MAIARYKDLCIDTQGGLGPGRFWAAALGLSFEPDDVGDRVAGRLTGPTPGHTIWMNVVPEPRQVKQRVHIDVHTPSLEALTDLGASVVDTVEGWTLMADPEGGEFCAFVREQTPAYRLYELVVDCADAAVVGHWWADVFDAHLQHDREHDRCWIEPVPDAPFAAMVFAPVSEPKTVKNRIHWDVSVAAVQPLLDRGASVLRRPGGDIDWFVLADPEGNEFCAFVD